MAEAQTKAQAEASAPQPVRLEDYRPPDYLVDQVELRFNLQPAATEVRARLAVRRNPAAGRGAGPLVLDGQELELIGLALDGEALGSNRYQVDDDHLIVHDVPAAFTLETTVRIRPDANTALEGLYVSNGVFCTQCEPEGFRKITYFPDRPDVMARYRVRIEADQATCPVLLANGNLIEIGASGAAGTSRSGRTRFRSRAICSPWLPAASPESRTRSPRARADRSRSRSIRSRARSTNAPTPWPRSRRR